MLEFGHLGYLAASLPYGGTVLRLRHVPRLAHRALRALLGLFVDAKIIVFEDLATSSTDHWCMGITKVPLWGMALPAHG